MAISVVTTLSGTTSNSYQTVAAITARAELLPGYAAWTALTDAEKNWCAVYAAKLLDALDWLGRKTADTQKLAHPRYNLPKQDESASLFGRGESYPSDAIAETVLEAQAIVAVGLAALGGSTATALTAQADSGFQSLKVGDIAMSFQGASKTATDALSFRGVADVLRGLHT